MAANQSARSLLGVVDDSGVEHQNPNRVRAYFLRFESPGVSGFIAGVFWPISLFGFNSNKIYLALLDLVMIIGSFVNGWEMYVFIAFIVGIFLLVAIHQGNEYDYPKSVRLGANILFLALVFYFSFPLDYWAAEAEIKSTSKSVASVDVAPPDSEDFIIVQLSDQRYQSRDDIYSDPATFATFISEHKDLATKSRDWSKTGVGLPFFKQNPTKLRFVFADKSETEIDMTVFSLQPSFKFTQGFRVSSENEKYISAGATATATWQGAYGGELAVGSMLNVLHSPSTGGPWSEVATLTYSEQGAFGDFKSPGAGYLKIQIPKSTHLPLAESETEPVPLN